MNTIYYVISSFANIPFRVKHFLDKNEAVRYYDEKVQKFSKDPDLTVNIIAEVTEEELVD